MHCCGGFFPQDNYTCTCLHRLHLLAPACTACTCLHLAETHTPDGRPRTPFGKIRTPFGKIRTLFGKILALEVNNPYVCRLFACRSHFSLCFIGMKHREK